MKLPSGKTVNKNSPIYPGSNFTWGEATKNCSRPCCDLIINGQTIINKFEIEQKIIETARNLDDVRELLGNKPIYINSWYRPPSVNRSVGGSSRSRHMFGDGVDIRSSHYSPGKIYALLDRNHSGGGLHHYSSFVHIDWRGVKARW